MSKKSDKSDDNALFHEQLGDAVPLNESRAEPYRRRLAPRPLNLPVGDEEESSQDHYSDHEIETGEVLYFARPGVQKRLMHDLQRGYLEIGGELDLHGLTVRYARADLDEFLKQCHQRRIRCVRIIHGKGYGSQSRQPILKHKLNIWLRQREDVLAFTSAPSRDGGTGAAYVLLRNPDKSSRR
ncbi:MAG: Smr/MutS family protein [Candidatus Thiodiazotropha taylori]|uniref:Smr/MutS family protein n=1 Tax=Candidatus Thiodiazotropha taylori TaxID=2792791 RepID=A0A9E4N4W7_9GAMM|nr:Smr/MutS family protein [Candidatus Thiodiazotropha taylori]RLW69336.1 MAG: DNA mismatch repair protein MutS [gamma proteobacterium symbiont of Stewartia floridana]MCG7954861.1 Smr/MutS family protein [Candidatus Thiodiazotropha taylori]MCG7967738.1 Smr/MutS family protein [Candidatus Thiodiazotropha taylori]MCG8041426.1 Smr/MutS family protein [Candidatus Thiodiazotropha taylori]